MMNAELMRMTIFTIHASSIICSAETNRDHNLRSAILQRLWSAAPVGAAFDLIHIIQKWSLTSFHWEEITTIEDFSEENRLD